MPEAVVVVVVVVAVALTRTAVGGQLDGFPVDRGVPIVLAIAMVVARATGTGRC